MLFLLLADNTDPEGTAWKKKKSVEVGIPRAQTRLLLDDGMSHSMTWFVLLPCNRLNISTSLRKRGCDRWPVCNPLDFSYIIYSGFNPPGRPPVWVRVDKHVEPGLTHPECFHCWAESRSCQSHRSLRPAIKGMGLDDGFSAVCLQSYCLCRAMVTVSTGCWGSASFLRTGWDEVAIRPQPGWSQPGVT